MGGQIESGRIDSGVRPRWGLTPGLMRLMEGRIDSGRIDSGVRPRWGRTPGLMCGV
jgi:hypothetical protein